MANYYIKRTTKEGKDYVFNMNVMEWENTDVPTTFVCKKKDAEYFLDCATNEYLHPTAKEENARIVKQ